MNKQNDEEYKVADTRGRFAQAVRSGRKVNDVDWTNGRIILSNKRVVMVSNEGKRTIPLSDVEGIGGRFDSSQEVARVSNYVSLRLGEEVFLLTSEHHDEFRTDLYRAFLDRRVIYARHPAVAGGVVQDTEFEQARLKVEPDGISVAQQSGSFVRLELDDIGTLEEAERTVLDEKRTVIEAEHTDEDGTSVQTYLSGEPWHVAVIKSYLKQGQKQTKGSIELSESEREVLMALYSGVSSFEVPNFLGMDVDRVEETFERLIELDVLEEVRTRREVNLMPRGRNIASEAMNEQ
ncbi:CheF family chemotaxis protein [Halorarum halobium]|uniref:CheF family chemotaxis protein n=1 Tax=Halorarum halobium TaxID=3075121 RepID=UPI0028AA0D6B|nr:CheF family chemotaxis protein [Halobaculum sp. XH14]